MFFSVDDGRFQISVSTSQVARHRRVFNDDVGLSRISVSTS
jgi:hypothetical protein